MNDRNIANEIACRFPSTELRRVVKEEFMEAGYYAISRSKLGHFNSFSRNSYSTYVHTCIFFLFTSKADNGSYLQILTFFVELQKILIRVRRRILPLFSRRYFRYERAFLFTSWVAYQLEWNLSNEFRNDAYKVLRLFFRLPRKQRGSLIIPLRTRSSRQAHEKIFSTFQVNGVLCFGTWTITYSRSDSRESYSLFTSRLCRNADHPKLGGVTVEYLSDYEIPCSYLYGLSKLSASLSCTNTKCTLCTISMLIDCL